jgi:tetratricopeptide (TPR) repeat protein
VSDLNAVVLRLWDFDDPDGSGARFAAASAVMQTQVARAYGLAALYEDGHAVLDSLVDKALPPEVRVRIALERGRLLRSAGDVTDSVPHFRAAYELASASGLAGLAADAAHMLALVLPDEQEEWTSLGLATAADSEDPLALGMTGALLNNLGWTHADASRWDEAYPLFERAVTAREKVVEIVGGKAAAASLHAARWTRARANRALGHRDLALAEMQQLAATDLGATDPYVAEELAALEGN